MPLPPPSSYAKIYYNPAHVAGFGTAGALAAAVRGSTLKHATEWLRGEDTYTLHKPARRRFKREQIFVNGLDHQWSTDLVSLIGLADYNGGHKYILCIIDALSKFAWARALKDKTNDSVIRAFKSVFAEGRKPKLLRFDRGSEFMGRKFIAFLKKEGIVHFTADHSTKEALIERFNRTLQSRLWKYFSATNRRRYVDVLQDFVAAYNDRKHSSIGTAPSTVTPYNAEDVWKRLYGHMLRTKQRPPLSTKRPLFKVGDLVRISKLKKHFEQSYKTNWSREFFTVHKIIHSSIPRYVLKDADGEIIVGTFQHLELQRARSTVKVVRKVVRRTADDSDVRWRGYPDSLTTRVSRP